MAKKGDLVIASRLGQLTGLPESTPFLKEFSALFEGPIHFRGE